jgi:hypothetical protein
MKLKILLTTLILTGISFAHSVTLKWKARVTGTPPDHYRVYRSSNGGPYQLMGVVPATSLSFVNGSNLDGSPLTEGTQECYNATSVAGATESQPTQPDVCVIIPITTGVQSPTMLVPSVQ